MTKESGVDPGPRRTRSPGKSVQNAALRAADAYRPAPAAVETAARRAARAHTAPRLPPKETCKQRGDTLGKPSPPRPTAPANHGTADEDGQADSPRRLTGLAGHRTRWHTQGVVYSAAGPGIGP
jgi:hypothetical protein